MAETDVDSRRAVETRIPTCVPAWRSTRVRAMPADHIAGLTVSQI